ncbi:FAD-containing monooxygenase EthA [Gammaproteobacteria bacterium 45_16_T64]|nr:FAD-containing monooxygenase EthA [Gammaproteobacteria bacterium 45_16_T64]
MKNETVDVVVIGAGLSGIGAAVHLSKRCPGKSYRILEGRDAIGGTWDLFRYPGIRSDSDMFTLGYNFKPWTSENNLADGPSILNYIKEAADEYNVTDNIHFGAGVKAVAWDSDTSRWSIQYTDKASGKNQTIVANFIISCTGYYNYDKGHEPEFKGSEDFKGQIIHPQKWPEDLDYSGKRVTVIGSGATAVTLVPEMSAKASHVTMLQRSPTYMAAVPAKDNKVKLLNKYLSEKWAYRILRTQKVGFQSMFYNVSRVFPKQIRNVLLTDIRNKVGEGVDMKHFKPSYNPWDERLCAVKSGDLFRKVKSGEVDIVTDHIDCFTETGIRLKSGEELPSDIIVTATGLNLQFFSGIDISVDGEKFDHTQKMNYKGVMLEDLPNIGFTFGYTNSSWTLKADLTSEYLCRVINDLDKRKSQKAMPVNRDDNITSDSFLSFQSGYVQRAVSEFPQMGSKMPWRLYQSYPVDLALLRYGRLHDGIMQYSTSLSREKSTLEEAV